MPSTDYIREKLIKLVRENKTINLRTLLRNFNSQSQADAQVGKLISDGVFITLGTGRRGNPRKIELSPIFSITRCPFCLQNMPENS